MLTQHVADDGHLSLIWKKYVKFFYILKHLIYFSMVYIYSELCLLLNHKCKLTLCWVIIWQIEKLVANRGEKVVKYKGKMCWLQKSVNGNNFSKQLHKKLALEKMGTIFLRLSRNSNFQLPVLSFWFAFEEQVFDKVCLNAHHEVLRTILVKKKAKFELQSLSSF